MDYIKGMKKTCMLVFGLFLALTFGLGILVSTNASDNEHIKKSKELSIGVVLSSLDKESNIYLKTVLEDEVLGNDMHIQIMNSNNSSKTQYRQVKELVRNGINVLAIDSVESNSRHIKSAVGYALSNDVKVIQIGSKISGYKSDISYVGFDNELSGDNVVSAILKYVQNQDKANGCKNNNEKDNNSGNERDKKDIEIARGKYDNVTTAIFLKEDNNTCTKEFEDSLKRYASDEFKLLKSYMLSCIDEEEITDILEKAICEYGKVDAVICNNDYIATLVYKVANRNKMNICITGQNSDIEACKRIANSEQVCTVYKSYEKQAKEIIRISKNLYSDGNKENVVIDTEVVDGSNLLSIIVGNGYHQASEIYSY